MEEAKLIRQIQKGSTAALEAAIKQYTAYVSTCAYRILGNGMSRQDIEEVVSDVFISLWTHAGVLDPERGTLRAWLGAAASNGAKNKLRSKAVTSPLPAEAPAPGSPALEVEQRDVSAKLWRAVMSLGEPDSELFMRYYYEGEKLKDIAAGLGIKESTAKTRLSRGRETLRTILGEELGGACFE